MSAIASPAAMERRHGSQTGVAGGARDLYARVGSFLFDHRLNVDPVTYAFAYKVVSDPHSQLARAVAEIVDGGVRLTSGDIDALGERIGATDTPSLSAEHAVAATQMQVEGFEDVVRTLHSQTKAFADDIEASAHAIRDARDVLRIDEVVAIAGAMVSRTKVAEDRLDAATREARELREKLEEARENARRDPLTGLPNRRALEDEYRDQSGAGAAITLAICDIDRFKRVNDTFGHAVGDRVLKAIGEALTETCTGHLVARYGGEEFAVLFAGITTDDAARLLEEARIAVAAKQYRVRETDQPLGMVTFSAGLAGAADAEAFGETFARADALLYEAKGGGRNRIRR